MLGRSHPVMGSYGVRGPRQAGAGASRQGSVAAFCPSAPHSATGRILLYQEIIGRMGALSPSHFA